MRSDIEDARLTPEMKSELRLALEDLARAVDDFGFDEDGVEREDPELYGTVYLRAVEEYETPNFMLKVEVTGTLPREERPQKGES